MIIRHLSIIKPTSKPQLHTRKNHDIYNGILHLPLATHVRVEYDDYYHHRPITNTNSTTSRSQSSPRYTRYIITLTYAHNRACEIYRSHDDVVSLRQALLAAGCRASPSHPPPPPPPPPPPTTTTTTIQPVASSNNNRSSSRKIDRSRACSCRCTCAVACPVLLPPPPAQRRFKVPVDDDTSAAARELQQLLEEGLKKVREGGEGGVGGGGGRARVPVEWFLRRRVGDCGGR